MNFHLQLFIEYLSHVTFWAATTIASAIGFSLHVLTSGKVHVWVSAHMKGRDVSPSRKVIIPAAILSIEMGLGLTLFYALVRDQLPFANPLLRGLALGLLALAVQGKLFRQPFMNWLIGNPVKVVLVQDGVVWVNWLLMSIVLAAVYEGMLR